VPAVLDISNIRTLKVNVSLIEVEIFPSYTTMSLYFTNKCFWFPMNELSETVTSITFDSRVIYSHIFTKNSKLLKISVHHVRRHLFWSRDHVCCGWANCHLENESLLAFILDVTFWVTVWRIRNTWHFLKWDNFLRQSGKMCINTIECFSCSWKSIWDIAVWTYTN
jgi:hypothetical protein